jgi:hypothetical protein
MQLHHGLRRDAWIFSLDYGRLMGDPKVRKICYKARAYSACAVMCGRSIEGVCKHHDPKTKTLANGLKKLREDGTIDDRIFGWGEALRENRNLGAHATTEKATKDDARDLLDFSVAICEYVFVLNKKFERFQKRRAKA